MTETKTKKHLTEDVQAILESTKAAADAAVDAVFSALSRALADGHAVRVRDFGTFRVHDLPQMTRRNPATGEPVEVPARKYLRLQAGQSLRARLNMRAAEEEAEAE